MGFLDKLFGNTPKQEEKQQTKPKVRAQFKDAKYFEKEIEKSPIGKNELKKMIANRDISLNNIAVASVDENKQLTITTY